LPAPGILIKLAKMEKEALEEKVILGIDPGTQV